MTEQLHITQQSDDEEEDLERLRLEALKTIHSKKKNMTVPQISSYHHQSSIQSRPISNPYKIIQPHVAPLNIYAKSNIPVDNINQHLYYPSGTQPDYNSPNKVRSLANHPNSYDARHRLEKLDINEPYVPQHVPPLNPPIVGGAGITPILSSISENWLTESTGNLIGSSYVPYVPHKITENVMGVSNVQLSPRSMAFVAENNDILMRRKGEKSNYESGYNRSPNYRQFSPDYRSSSPNYRSSPRRWSHSPPVSRSNRQHSSYAHRKSPSPRSPHSGPRSPVFRRKSLSRSPPPRTARHASPTSSSFHRYQSKSPPPQSNSNRRGKSRSPLVHSRHKISPSRRLSRSPNPSNRYGRASSRSPPSNVNNDKKRSPQGPPSRYTNRSRGNSPSHSKRSPVFSRTNDTTGEITAKHTACRSRSPTNQSTSNYVNRKGSTSPRPRSRSRSPVRKYQRRSRDRNTQFNRKRSPYDRNTRRRNDGGGSVNGFRNRNRKRSGSPMNSKRKRSRTKSPERGRRDDNRPRKFDRDRRKQDDYNGRNEKWEDKVKNSEDKYKNNSQSNVIKKDEREDGVGRKDDKISSRDRKSERQDDKTLNKNAKEDKVQKLENKSKEDEGTNDDLRLTPIKEIEQQKSNDKNDGKQTKNNAKNDQNDDEDNNNNNEEDSSDDDDDDGIDLFASDESESENEGRFKLSSGKSERKTQVSTLSFTKLVETSAPVKDLQEITSTNRNNSTKNENVNSRSSEYDNRRRGDDRFKKSDGGGRNNDRRRNNRDRRERDENAFKIEDKRGNENKPMFKSTFTVVENEGKSNGNFSLDRNLNDKKNSLQLKKKLQVKDSLETDMSSTSDKLSSTIGTSTISSLKLSSTGSGTTSTTTSSSSGSSTGGKKPIHLRLGAMTNTFKAPSKKSSSSPSSSSEKTISL